MRIEKHDVDYVRNMLDNLGISMDEVGRRASSPGLIVDRKKVAYVIRNGYVSEKYRDAIIPVLKELHRNYQPPTSAPNWLAT